MLRFNMRCVCVALLIVAQGPMSASFGMDSQHSAGRTPHHDYTVERCSTGIADNVTAAELTNGYVNQVCDRAPHCPRLTRL